MNGPAHYREAERCLQEAFACTEEQNYLSDWNQRQAQVHATLALAAAAALNDPQGGMGGNDWHAWHDAVSVDAMTASEGEQATEVTR